MHWMTRQNEGVQTTTGHAAKS